MTDFEYLSVLISIVLGLGVANTLTGLAGIVRHRDRLDMFWPMPLALVTLFLIHVQTWWTLFGLRYYRHWTFTGFLLVLAQPVLLFVMTMLMVPDFAGERRIDLRTEFFRDRIWFFASLLTLLVFSIARQVFLTNSLPRPADLAAHAAFAVLSVIAIAFRNERVHMAIAVMMFFLFVAYVADLFVNLS